MTRDYSSEDASSLITELGYTLGEHELSRQARLGRVGTRHDGKRPFYRFTRDQLVKYLKTRRKRGRQLKPAPKSVTVDLEPESDEAKELFAMLEDMTHDN